MNKKKENLWLAVLTVVLVVSCVGSAYYKKTTTSLITNAQVLAVSDSTEFYASADGSYEKGILTVEIQTNAPSGSILTVYAQHPDLAEELWTKTTVKQGIAEAYFPIAEDLSPNFLIFNAVLDMAQQEGRAGSVTAKRYGAFGENMTGGYVFTEDGVYFNGVSEIGFIPYPSLEAIQEIQKGVFSEYMYYLVTSFPEFFYAIAPSSTGEWDDITVTLSDYLVEAGWETLDPEERAYMFEIFEEDPVNYFAVDEDTVVKVTFKDTSGNIIDKNY